MILHARALIYIYNTHFQFLGKEIYSVWTLSKEWAAYSVFGGIDKLNGLRIIIYLLESHHRPKELLSLCSHSIICIYDYGWLKEPPFSILICILVSTDYYLSAHINSILANL